MFSVAHETLCERPFEKLAKVLSQRARVAAIR